MNDQSAGFPHQGAVLPFGASERLPAHSGLRDVVAARPAVTQSGFSLSEVWRVVAKWWWLIAAITIACLLAAIVAALLVRPEYRATATLEVNREGGVQVVQMGEVAPMGMGDREFMATQAGLLRSRALAERVARSLNLANNEFFVDQSVDRSARDLMAVDRLHNSIEVVPVRDSRLIELNVESTSPELAARVANTYAENFIQSNLERRFEATSYARNFLEQRLATVKARLEDSERQLVSYAQRQGIISLEIDSGSGEGGRREQTLDASSLLAMNQALSVARAERIAAEQRFRQAQANRSTTDVLNNPTVQRLTGERAELQAQYQEKLGIFQPDYPQMVQLRSRIESLTRAIQQEGSNVSSALRSEYAAAVARENQLQGRVDQLKNSLLNLRERSIQYTILQREVDTNRSLYDALLQRYKEVGVAGGVGANAVSVVDPARTPRAPFKPNLPLNIAIGLVAGLLLGFGAAFGLEWMDDTIKTPDDVTAKLGLAPIGIIPRPERGEVVQDQLEDARSQISEAYQSVRAALQFSTDHGVPKTLLVTSTRAAEGKSSSALALARTLASLGSTVLLIDSDLRKPTFRGPKAQSEGLTNLLAGSDDIEGAIHPTSYEGLFLLPGGQIPPNPAELLASGRIGIVIDRVRDMFDYVVIDGPPVLGLADAPLLSSQVEGTLMIIESGVIRRAAALNAVNRLRASGANMMGAVLTKFSATKAGYGYGYGYGYGGDAYSYREGEAPKKQIELLKTS
ncbi:MAG: GumC family protein [Allosphingosinicella sp.]|uniref:GumC family protein n=1 Tax=Allosphingosinicella sp. TaxID=2823234 RepID=UPI003927DAF4